MCHDCNNPEVQLADARKVAEAEGLTLVPSSSTTGFKGVRVSGGRFLAVGTGEKVIAWCDSIAAAALAYARYLGPEGSDAAAAAAAAALLRRRW